MSIEALNWAWQQSTPNPTSKLVLLAIADHANGDGECWPSMKKIAVMAQVSPRQVSYHITMLAKLGLLVKANRRRHDGQWRGWTYRLATSGSLLPVASGSPASSPAEASFRSEPSENRQEEPCAPAARKRTPDLLFEAVAEACGLPIQRLTGTQRGRLNRAVKELRDIEATPDEVTAAAKRYRTLYPEATLTPQALTGNWATIQPPPRPKPHAATEWCERCGTDLDLPAHDTEYCDAIVALN